MAEIVWSEPALSDLEAIADFIAVENRDAAAQLVQRVVAHVGQLVEYRESGSRPKELKRSRYRQVVEPACRVFYRYDHATLYMVHVMRTERLLRVAELAGHARSRSGRGREERL